MLLEEDVIESISRSLMGIDGISFAILFGSSVSGFQHNFSDIDIAIYLTSDDIGIMEILRALPDVGKPIDVKVLNDAPPLFRLRVLRDGKILFIRDEGIYKEFVYRTLVEALEFKDVYYEILDEVSKVVLGGI